MYSKSKKVRLISGNTRQDLRVKPALLSCDNCVKNIVNNISLCFNTKVSIALPGDHKRLVLVFLVALFS